MVIYGHDTQANTALFDWLRAIGLEPREWSQLIHATGCLGIIRQGAPQGHQWRAEALVVAIDIDVSLGQPPSI